MGYTSIAGMPVVTGLYTILLPIFAFALLGSSRHLVVGADSATAAVMAAALASLAVAGSSQYVALAGLLALMAAALLLIARLIGLGFLADFLSRTVLIGFLTGVGIQVACGQIGGMLGIPEGKGVTIHGHEFTNTIGKLLSTLKNLDQISWTTVAVSAGVLTVIVGLRLVNKKIPGALIAVVGSILISWAADLSSHGVATLGKLPGGLPNIGFPQNVTWSDVTALLGTAVSIFVLILAQSAATARAYAAKYNDRFDENVDLAGLAGASAMAGLSGTFVVNGSPTKTQMVDGAGGRSQLAQVTTGVIVMIVLLFLTAPIQYMPQAVLASVVFLIGIELVDLAGMGKILHVPVDEFVVATLVAATVVIIGVEQGIVLAIVASLIDHLRRSYRPPTAVLQPLPGGPGFRGVAATPDARSAPGWWSTASPARFTTPTPSYSTSRSQPSPQGMTRTPGCASIWPPCPTSTTPAATPSAKYTSHSPITASIWSWPKRSGRCAPRWTATASPRSSAPHRFTTPSPRPSTPSAPPGSPPPAPSRHASTAAPPRRPPARPRPHDPSRRRSGSVG
jgi:MFS superfamily sulfate permease-like transporter